MLKPHAGEDKKAYLSRCMGDPEMQKYEDKQRYAVCNSYWDNKDNQHALMMLDLEVLEWKEGDHPRHPKGKGDGGKFAPKDGGDGSEVPSTHDELLNRIEGMRENGADEEDISALVLEYAHEHGIETKEIKALRASGARVHVDTLDEAIDSLKTSGHVGSADKDLNDARNKVLELRKANDKEAANRLDDAAHDWRNVVKALSAKPGSKDYDPEDGKIALESWQEEYGHNSLSEMVDAQKVVAKPAKKKKGILDPDAKKLGGFSKEGLNMPHKGPHMDAEGNVVSDPQDCEKCKEDAKGNDEGRNEHARVEVVSSGQGGERINFNAAFSLEQSDPEKGTMVGTASMFGSMIDTFPPTRMSKGAFKKTLSDKEALKRVKILYQHNTDWPIGKPTSLKETPNGLQVAAAISKTTMGQDVLTLMKDGVIDELSVGFDPVSWRMVKEDGQMDLVRHLDEVHLWEISAVTFAADRNARILSVHSVQAFQDLPLAEVDHAWDAGAAIARLKDWASSNDEIDYGKYRRAFLWCGEPHDQQGSYKLPIADVVDGTLKAVPRAIFAAAARLSSTDIPEADKKKVQAHLSRYYKKLDRTPPWSSEGASNIRATAEWLASLPLSAGVGRQAKALAAIANEVASTGGVGLTARSRSYIEEAIVAFKGLLQSAELPPNGAATERQRQDAAIGQRLRELNLAAIEAGILI